MNLNGIDVPKYQSAIDWPKIAGLESADES